MRAPARYAGSNRSSNDTVVHQVRHWDRIARLEVQRGFWGHICVRTVRRRAIPEHRTSHVGAVAVRIRRVVGATDCEHLDHPSIEIRMPVVEAGISDGNQLTSSGQRHAACPVARCVTPKRWRAMSLNNLGGTYSTMLRTRAAC